MKILPLSLLLTKEKQVQPWLFQIASFLGKTGQEEKLTESIKKLLATTLLWSLDREQ